MHARVQGACVQCPKMHRRLRMVHAYKLVAPFDARTITRTDAPFEARQGGVRFFSVEYRSLLACVISSAGDLVLATIIPPSPAPFVPQDPTVLSAATPAAVASAKLAQVHLIQSLNQHVNPPHTHTATAAPASLYPTCASGAARESLPCLRLLVIMFYPPQYPAWVGAPLVLSAG